MPAFILSLGIAVWLGNGLPTAPHNIAGAALMALKEQGIVDQSLAAWEKKTSDKTTSRCNFKRYQFDSTFSSRAAGRPESPISASDGEMIFAAPNHVSVRETQLRRPVTNAKTGKLELVGNGSGDYLTYDGNALSFVDRESKCVHRAETKADSTIEFTILSTTSSIRSLDLLMCPFGFPVSASDLKSRYVIRNITLPTAEGRILLEMTPRDPSTTLFTNIQVLLGSDAIPLAMVLQTCATERTVIHFEKPQFDSPEPLAADTFAPHPDGYKVIGR